MKYKWITGLSLLICVVAIFLFKVKALPFLFLPFFFIWSGKGKKDDR